jgi:hypothetical protein
MGVGGCGMGHSMRDSGAANDRSGDRKAGSGTAFDPVNRRVVPAGAAISIGGRVVPEIAGTHACRTMIWS